MARYIDADKAVEEARLSYCKDCDSYNGVRCRACGFDDAMMYIEDAPTADVVEVKHGRIIETIENGRMKRVFSCCGTDFTELTKWILPTYCPLCGAKMDEKKVK